MKNSYDTSFLVINDPSSLGLKNVTPNCFNFGFIKNYFKSIGERLGIVRYGVIKKCLEIEKRLSDEGIRETANEFFNSKEGKDIYKKIFGLKEFSECVDEF